MARDIFRVTSAGSVDDGKSTILARLLLDTGSVFEDQLGGIDPRTVDATTIADLLDGLDSEREQGITIDVAHRFFDSASRRYHLADSPGHEQYTRNMATAASHADGLLLVVDARLGVKPQTKTHLGIARMLGLTQCVVAVNKMDLVGFKKKKFVDVKESIEQLLAGSDIDFFVVPVSGLTGDNIVRPSRRMSWWSGETILGVLDRFTVVRPRNDAQVFSIQSVQRIPGGGRRYLGSLLSGTLGIGEPLVCASYPDTQLQVVEIYASGVAVSDVTAPAELSVRFDDEVDIGRGDVLASESGPEYTDQFEADVVWLDDEAGLAGRAFQLRIGHTATNCTLTRIFQLSEAGEKRGAISRLEVNTIARVNFETQERVALSSFHQLPSLGRLVLVDRHSGNTVSAGVVNHSLRRAENVVEHEFTVSSVERSVLTGREGRVLWFTGLSGSGKSTLSDAVSVALTEGGVPHSVLDGDSLRTGLTRDLSFSEADRVENLRRTAEVARLMADAGLIVLVSLISPYRADREKAREIVGPARFFEVFVDTPLEVCEKRDSKGLYKKARAGLIPNFTGIGAPYEPPVSPDLRVAPAASQDSTVKACLGLALD
jgi:bifunctional enzyme CysN/CysC